MGSQVVLLTAVLLVFQICNVFGQARVEYLNQPYSSSTAPIVQTAPQIVVPAIIKPVIQPCDVYAQDNVPIVPNFGGLGLGGGYPGYFPDMPAPLPPIIIDGGDDDDSWHHLLYFLIFAMRNRRCGGGYGGCGGYSGGYGYGNGCGNGCNGGCGGSCGGGCGGSCGGNCGGGYNYGCGGGCGGSCGGGCGGSCGGGCGGSCAGGCGGYGNCGSNNGNFPYMPYPLAFPISGGGCPYGYGGGGCPYGYGGGFGGGYGGYSNDNSCGCVDDCNCYPNGNEINLIIRTDSSC